MRTIPRSLQALIDDPIVRLMMAADRVVEGEMLVILSRACDRVYDAGPAPEELSGYGARSRHDIPSPLPLCGSALDGIRIESRSAP